jgi:hypothetical protein
VQQIAAYSITSSARAGSDAGMSVALIYAVLLGTFLFYEQQKEQDKLLVSRPSPSAVMLVGTSDQDTRVSTTRFRLPPHIHWMYVK